MKTFIRFGVLALISIILSGCSRIPTRADGLRFKLIQQNSILPQSGLEFSFCLFDGWDGYKGFSRQLRRPDSYRIDIIGGEGSIMIASADIFDDGKVQLLLNRDVDGSSILDYTKYSDVFTSCLMQNKKSVPINSPER